MKISTIKNRNSFLYKVTKPLVVYIFWIAIWQLIYMSVGKEVIIPSPLSVFLRIYELAGTTEFWQSVITSFLRIMEGFFLAAVSGIALSALMTRFRAVEHLISPILSLIKATPVASFIILALIWLQSKDLSIFISFLMVLPIFTSNMRTGIMSADKELLEVAYIYRFSKIKKIRMIYIPAVSGYFISACRTGIGFSWKAGISAEVLGRPAYSIGKEIYDSKIYLETVNLFAYTVTVIILSICIEKFVVFFLDKINK